MDYFNPLDIDTYMSNLYHNYEYFDAENYGEQSVMKASKMTEINW